MELLKFMWAAYEVPSGVPGGVRVVALPVNTVFQCLPVQLTG
jgi:hypothetical protein